MQMCSTTVRETIPEPLANKRLCLLKRARMLDRMCMVCLEKEEAGVAKDDLKVTILSARA